MVLVLMLALGLMNGFAQTKMTEGKIVYSITYPDSLMKQIVGPSKHYDLTYWFKGKKQRI